jgi:hypothetical protein
MSAGWVAGVVRGRALAARCLGRERARQLAGSDGLAEALAELTRTAYGRELGTRRSLADAEHAVHAAAVWHLRVLAGWLPAAGTGMLRALAAWYEAVDIEGRLATLAGQAAEEPYALGALSTSWARMAGTASLGELRRALARSTWGDVGSDDPAVAGVSLRLAWARRVAAEVPGAAAWASGQAALLVAIALAGKTPLAGPAHANACYLLGSRWQEVDSLHDLSRALPRAGGWVLDGIATPGELWRAELAWWNRVDADSAALVAAGQPGPQPAMGAAGRIIADAWRVGAALEAAARTNRELADALG